MITIVILLPLVIMLPVIKYEYHNHVSQELIQSIQFLLILEEKTRSRLIISVSDNLIRSSSGEEMHQKTLIILLNQ